MVDATSYLLLVLIIGIGGILGATAYRDQIAQEFGDLGVSLEQLDQSYSFTVGTTTYAYDDTPGSLENPVMMSAAAGGEGALGPAPGGQGE